MIQSNKRLISLLMAIAVCAGVSGLFMPFSRAAEDGAKNAEKGRALMKTFDYDAKKPLDAEAVSVRKAGGYEEFHILYNGADGKVPASLYIPVKKTAGPFPCVIAMHGYGMEKSMGAMFAGQLAPKGYAVFSIDAQYHGERRAEGKDMLSTNVESNARAMVQTIIDLRRGIDYLASRGDIDMAGIGYTGISMGAFLGFVTAGVDARIKSSVMIVGGGDWEKMIAESKVPPYDALRALYAKEKLPYSDYEKKMEMVEPLYFAPLISPRKLLLLNCSKDLYVPRVTTEEVYAGLPEPKEIEWMECPGATGHIPPMDRVIMKVRKRFDETLKK